MTVPFPDAWADTWDSYEYAELTRGHSPKSVRTRRTSVLRLAKMLPEWPPEKITRRDLEKHITAIRKTLRPGTVVGSHNDLRSFFGWLAADTGRGESIMKDMPSPKTVLTDVPVLTPDQLRAVISTCKGDGMIALRDRAILLMFLETGLRRSELAALTVGDVSVKEGTAFVKRGKGGRSRIVIFGPATADALRKYLRAVRPARLTHWGAEDGPLFLSRFHGALGYSGIGLMVKKRGRDAGIPELHTHMLRHAWCHYALDSGVGDQNVCTLAGWSSPRQLGRYGRAMAVQRAMTAGRAHPVAAVLRKR